MSNWKRRSFLAAGVALAAGGRVAAKGVTAKTTTADPEPVAETPGWSSYRGNAANARFVATDRFPAPDTVAWEYEHSGELATVGGTVYLRTDDGELHALDAQDGSLEWTWEDLAAQGTPAVADGTVYVVGDQLTALDAEDGDRLWAADFESGESVASPTVAYGTVYVIADGTLYAVDAATGSITWQRDSLSVETQRAGPDGVQTLTEDRPFHSTPVAVAHETVYARTVAYPNEEYDGDNSGFVAIGALDAATGDSVWVNDLFDQQNNRYLGVPVVSGDQVYFYGQHSTSIEVEDGFDLKTGESSEIGGLSEMPVVSNDEFRVTGSIRGMGVTNLERDESAWGASNPAHWENAPFLNPLIVGKMLIVYNNGWDHDAYNSRSLLGFALEDGTVKWSLSVAGLDNDARIRADEKTLYIITDESLLAVRSSQENGSDDESTDNEPSDTDEEIDDSEHSDDESTDSDAGTTEPTEADGGSDDEGAADDDDDPADEARRDGADEAASGNDIETDDADESGTQSDDAELNGQESDESADDDANATADGVPGFTTGAGLAGGALSLEWLRRRAASDELDK